ncbi:MAG: methyltransferase domain-containing protein [Steroidobacteraceae bacterium]
MRLHEGDDSAARSASLARDELLERLQYFKLEPRDIVDLGCGSGESAAALRRRFPRARVIAVDIDFALTQQARRAQRFWRRFDCVCADARALPFAAQSVDLVFSNLVLPHCDDPARLFGEVQRTLRPNGLLLFATLGPGSAPQLPDMPQLGAALGAAGLAEPVMDREQLAHREFIFGAAFAGRRAAGAEAVVPLSSLRTRSQP